MGDAADWFFFLAFPGVLAILSSPSALGPVPRASGYSLPGALRQTGQGRFQWCHPSSGSRNGELEGSARAPLKLNGELEGSARAPLELNGELEGSVRALPSNSTGSVPRSPRTWPMLTSGQPRTIPPRPRPALGRVFRSRTVSAPSSPAIASRPERRAEGGAGTPGVVQDSSAPSTGGRRRRRSPASSCR